MVTVSRYAVLLATLACGVANCQVPVAPGAPGRVVAETSKQALDECVKTHNELSIRRSGSSNAGVAAEVCGVLKMACAVGAVAEECTRAREGIRMSLAKDISSLRARGI